MGALAMAALGGVAPAQARVPQGFFGVMWDRAVTGASDSEQGQQWDLMATSGVESVRAVFYWSAAQPEAGQAFDYARTDRVVSLAAAHNVKLLPVVLGTPGWAARRPGDAGSPPRRHGDYTAYLRALVLRYGPAGSFWDEHSALPRRPLREWQIWNEPHLDEYWSTNGQGAGSWAPDYVRLLRASKSTIESVDRGATIVLAGLADFSWKHLTRLYRHGVRGHFDVAAMNLFTSRPRKVLRGLSLFRSSLRRGGERTKPVWLTETTWPAGKGLVPRPRPAWQRAWYTTDDGMAQRLTRLYALAARKRRKFRLGRVFWYTWASTYRDGDLFDYAGLIRYAGGQFEPRPALDAYEASARRFEGCTKTRTGVCPR
jgi:hypothetical protein